MPDQNPIYDFMKSNKLTDLDEKTFLNKYSAPEKAKEVHSFFVENNLTDLDSAKFYDKYLKKKEQLTPSVSSSTKSQSVLPDFEKGRAFAEKGFLMQGEGTKKQQKISFEPSLSMATPFEVKVLEEGEEPSFASDLVTAGARGQIQGKVANLLPAGKVPTNEELGEIAQLQTDAKLLPQSKAEKAYQEKGLKGLFYENPLLGAQFVGETMLSSLASLAEASTRTLPTAIAAGAGAGAAFGGIGALPGAAIGMLAGQSAAGYNLSTSQDILNSLSENGVDISNKESLINAFADENKMAKIRTTAAKYGVPILLFDAATAGLAGKLATGAMGKSLSRKLLAGLGEAGIQMTGGAGGELAGQIASGKKINWDDVAVEAIAEVPGGVTEVATGVALERSKTSSNNNTLATQIATQGPEDGTKDAILNLNRDLANNVITPEQHQEGMDFVEKAVQVSNKIPETVTGESKAKSIELLVERNNIKENNQILEQQKQSADEAYHAGIDEEIKANEEKIKKIDSEVYNIAKNPIPVKEKSVVQISEPTEEIPVVEEYDLKNGDIITANIGGKKEKGRVTGVGRNKGEIVIDFIDENNNERFVYGNQIENIEKGQAEIDNLSKAQKERKVELLNKEELTQDELDELDKLNKAKAEVKQIESAKPNLEDEYNSKTVDELIALKKKLYPNPDIESPMTPEEKLLDKVIAKKFSEKNQEIIAKRKAAAEEVKPTEVKDGFDYIRNKFIEDVSGGKRLSDKESNILNKEVDKLIERAEKENGVKRNELKQSTWKTNDGYTVTEFFENGRGGTRITTPKGEEINIFDNKYKGESGKDISYFPKAAEVKPTEVKVTEEVKPTESEEKHFDRHIELVKKNGRPLSKFKVGDRVIWASDYLDNFKQYAEGTIIKTGDQYEIKRFAENPTSKRFKTFVLSSDELVIPKPEGEAPYAGKENLEKTKKPTEVKTEEEPQAITKEEETNKQLAETELLLSGEAEKRRKEGKFIKDGIEYNRNEKQKGEVGYNGEVRFTNDVSLPFKYKLVEAETIQPSHENGIRNPLHFVPEAQPKNRNDIGSLQAEESFANNPRFDELGENTNAYSGSPVVNERGEVIQGNNRSAGLRKGYKRGNVKYKTDLANNAEKFGFTKEQVEGMNNPVLVREIAVSDAGAIELGNYDVKDLETGGKRRLDPVSITRRMPFELKGRISEVLFKGDDTLNKSLRDNSKKILELISPYLNQSQRNTLFKDGTLTESGAKDLEAVVQHFLFDGGDVALPDLFESLSHTQKEGLRKSLPSIFSTSSEKSITPQIQEAIIAINSFNESGINSFDNWLTQTDMFNEGKTPNDTFSPTAIAIAKVLNTGSQKEIVAEFAKYADAVKDKPATMFEGATEGVSKKDAIKQIFKTEYDETAEQQKAIGSRSGKETVGEQETIEEPKPKSKSKSKPKPTESQAVKDYKEAVKKAGKKARENAKNEFVDRNFDKIIEKLKIEIKCPT